MARLRSGPASWEASIGAVLVLGSILIACVAPLIAPYDPIQTDATAALQAPSLQHLAGTDQLGRDVLSRVIFGGRVTITASLLAALGSVVIGAAIGLFVAYSSRWADEIVMRFVDAVLAVPAMLALLVTVTVFGSSIPVLSLAVVVIFAPAVARVVRAAAREIRPLDYVTVARARGERSSHIIFREILPNISLVLIVEFAVRASWAALVISGLSFLGFGVSPPTPDWGLMVAENGPLLSIAAWVSLAPIIALSSLVVGLNLAADGLSKAIKH